MFPPNVIKYSLDESNVLEVQLERPCLTKFESVVYFERVVRANLSEGKLWGIEGLSNKELFLWLPVKGIIVNYPISGLAMIDITMANKTVSLSVFERPHTCQPQGIYIHFYIIRLYIYIFYFFFSIRTDNTIIHFYIR